MFRLMTVKQSESRSQGAAQVFRGPAEPGSAMTLRRGRLHPARSSAKHGDGVAALSRTWPSSAGQEGFKRVRGGKKKRKKKAEQWEVDMKR